MAPIPDMSLGGMLAVDVACKDQMIAVEFDGPSHNLKEVHTGKITLSENGSTKAKRVFLEKLGWTVINIDYRDWIKVKRVGNEKQYGFKRNSELVSAHRPALNANVARNCEVRPWSVRTLSSTGTSTCTEP